MRWIDAPQVNVPYYIFENIENSREAECAFTTRFYKKDGQTDDFFQPLLRTVSDPSEVKECIRLLTEQFGTDSDHLVHSAQKHTANIHRVTNADLGPQENRTPLSSIDGLITDIPGVMLQTFGADCPLVYLLDPVERAIGLCHSGRKGTQQHIAGKMLSEMAQAYGTRAENVLAAISPGICCSCYEVGDDVAEEFARDYYASADGIWQQAACEEQGKAVAPGDPDRVKKDPKIYGFEKNEKNHPEIMVRINGRYHLDLNQAIARTLKSMGVPESQIEIAHLCTRCRSDIFYSFRAQGCITNENSAVLMLK